MGYQSPTTTARYAYDAIERRIAKAVDGVTEAYVLDQLSEPNTLEPSNIVLSFEGGTLATRRLHSDMTDEPLGIERYAPGATLPGTGDSHGLYADREGSVTDVVSDATGMVAAEYAYAGFGTRGLVSGGLSQPYGYRGRELDAESGLYHLRWRAYDPSTGRFLQADPIGFGGGQENLYAYVDNNPFEAGDPMGLSAYYGLRVVVNGQHQILGGASRSISSGALSALQSTITAMGDWNNFTDGPRTLNQLAPGTGKRHHGNCGRSEQGQHVYAIYETTGGMTLKVGVRNNRDLFMNNSQSRRAIRQCAEVAAKSSRPVNQGSLAHSVLIIIPAGLLARGQAYILENAIVGMLGAAGLPVDLGGAHQMPDGSPPPQTPPPGLGNC